MIEWFCTTSLGPSIIGLGSGQEVVQAEMLPYIRRLLTHINSYGDCTCTEALSQTINPSPKLS